LSSVSATGVPKGAIGSQPAPPVSVGLELDVGSCELEVVPCALDVPPSVSASSSPHATSNRNAASEPIMDTDERKKKQGMSHGTAFRELPGGNFSGSSAAALRADHLRGREPHADVSHCTKMIHLWCISPSARAP
jgi:hypothetical protein